LPRHVIPSCLQLLPSTSDFLESSNNSTRALSANCA